MKTTNTEILIGALLVLSLGLGIAAPVQATDYNVTVKLLDSQGYGLQGGLAEYFHSTTSWQVIGTTGGDGIVSADLPVKPSQIRMTYEWVTNRSYQDISVDPVVIFNTIDVLVTLKTCAGVGLEGIGIEGGDADYQSGYWRPIGTTDENGEIHKEMLPANLLFRMTYAYGTDRFSQDTGLNPVVNFVTTTVTSDFDGTIEYQSGYWWPFISPMEMMPGTYLFKFTNSEGVVIIRDYLTITGCEMTIPPVSNQSPVANPGGPYLGAVDAPISFDGTGSSDPDGDPLTYVWDFGDGNTGTGGTPSHSYISAGIYNVCLIVNDGTADSEPACTIAVVYDPDGGFVTGGGWIWSFPGAYKRDPSLEGKANFGFVAKYKKGASVPEGQTEFMFKVADLNFHSTSYDWLVVTGSNYAMFKGIGTINGFGAYKFMLWAGDRQPDTFRIKIWTEDELGVETIEYDNGMDQAIGGGSIVVHTR